MLYGHMEPWEKGVLQGVGLRWGGVRGALLYVLAARARFFWLLRICGGFVAQQQKNGRRMQGSKQIARRRN